MLRRFLPPSTKQHIVQCKSLEFLASRKAALLIYIIIEVLSLEDESSERACFSFIDIIVAKHPWLRKSLHDQALCRDKRFSCGKL